MVLIYPSSPFTPRWLLMELPQPTTGLQHAVFQLYYKVTKPKAKLKLASPKRSEVDVGRSNQVPAL